jgi:hypothetical protein
MGAAGCGFRQNGRQQPLLADSTQIAITAMRVDFNATSLMASERKVVLRFASKILGISQATVKN